MRLEENQSAHCASFNNSGYEKGQLVSSRDLNFNRMAMLSTSTFSNVVPMYPVFKEGIYYYLFTLLKKTTVLFFRKNEAHAEITVEFNTLTNY